MQLWKCTKRLQRRGHTEAQRKKKFALCRMEGVGLHKKLGVLFKKRGMGNVIEEALRLFRLACHIIRCCPRRVIWRSPFHRLSLARMTSSSFGS